MTAVKSKAVAERKHLDSAKAKTTREKLRERIAATAKALAIARAELAETRKRQALLVKMAENKEAAITSFVEKWSKKEMARIDKAMKPKKSRSSR
jgi:hypothetical protein